MTKPSRQFIYRAFFLIIVIILFVTLQSSWFKNLFKKDVNILQKDTKGLILEKRLNDVVGLDSNNNSIADWEESLWGLDPNVTQTDGVLNSDIVIQKRAKAEVMGTDIKNATASDRLAYGLYTSTAVLANTDSSGADPVSNDIVKNLSKSLAPAYYKSKYESSDIKIVPTNSKNVISYYKKIQSITSETTNKVSGNTEKDLNMTSDSYQKLAKDLVEVSVPTTLARNHLILVNDFAGIGDLLKSVGSENIDQLGVANNTITYSQYTKSIDDCLAEIAQIYTNYSIIKS